MRAFRYLVAGRVQGVGYRYYVLRCAQRGGVAGFARNMPDGRVEVVAEGEETALLDLEDRLRQGSSFGQVDSLEREEIAPRGDAGFHIR